MAKNEEELREARKQWYCSNWLKSNRKALNAGKMKPERVEKFRKLLELTEQYRKKNQYQ